MPISDVKQSLDNLKLERDAIVLYDALASIEREGPRAQAFRRIAGNERRHADIWASKLVAQGAVVPPAGRARPRVRFIIGLARVFGTRAVSDLVQALEGDEENAYNAQESPEVASIAADEREHAEIWKQLTAEPGTPPAGAGNGTTNRNGAAPEQAVSAGVSLAAAPATTPGAAASAPATPDPNAAADRLAARQRSKLAPKDIARHESWHKTGQSGTLRAVIFGVSDGLTSNLSLVMGVAGASADPKFILLAGIAGLLAGSFSMAAGEYVSMKSQRELYERQIALERAELEAMPQEEQAELASIYRSKGFSDSEARTIAERIFQDPEAALDTLVREELGLDPSELGSPVGAAIGSFCAFAVGAVVPVAPYLFGGTAVIFTVSLVLSLISLFAVGAAVSLLTGRSLVFSGARQVVIGGAAAAVTFAVGHVIGVAAG
jgi:VIT1/CCC1 family predicted Fe2+/Mn2+ transporter